MQNARLRSKRLNNANMAIILVLHGPNLNLLGSREIEHYGRESLDDINTNMNHLANELGHSLDAYQSNHEGQLIDLIHDYAQKADFMIINPAGLTHTSISLRDALLAVGTPFVEVHLSNVYRRETFRHLSYFADIAIGTISGLGSQGYLLALRYAHHHLLNINHDTIGANETLWTYEKLEN
jgi:3-dehydroquinate dehydratase-2